MRIQGKRFFLALLVFSISSLLTTARVDGVIEKVDEVSLESLSDFISLSTSYIVRVSHTAEQDPSNPGKFTYIAHLDKDLQLDFSVIPQKSYNLLRHNGAIYSLALSYERQPDPDVVDAMTRSVAYLKTFAVAPVPDVSEEKETESNINELPNLPNLLAAWENKAVTGETHRKAKLGGAGLALIALVALEKISPGGSNLDYLRKLGEFIRYMQHDDGSFTCRYIPSGHGRDDSWTSLYYPGEAALGLIYLASIENDEHYKQRWITVATKALVYLERLRRTQDLDEIEPDHWALLATQKLLPLLSKDSKEYWLVYDHGVRVSKSMVSIMSKHDMEHVHYGCFSMDERTCPTATRLEGLIAALSFVRPTEMFTSDQDDGAEPLLDRMRTFIRIGIKFLLKAQERDDRHNMHGGMPETYSVEDPSESETEVRIDYVQHSMSAMIAYEKLLLSEKRGFLSATSLGGDLGDGNGWLYLLIILLLVGVGVAASSKRKPKKIRVV